MKVAYVTPYYNGDCDGRFGRFHDWVHTAAEMDSPPFEFDIYPFTVSNGDETVACRPKQVLGEATELWGTKWNKPEFILNASQIRSALRSGAYDLVHVLVMDTIVLPTVLSLRPEVPVVVGPDIAGWSPIRDGMFASETQTEWLKNRASFLLKNLLARTLPFDHSVVFSEHHRNIVESFAIPPEKTSVLHGGVAPRFNHDRDHELGEPPELLYVGDMNSHKGYPLFLEALAGLEVPVSARVIGSGDPNRGLIEDLNLTDQVTVEGFVPRKKLPAYYDSADLYVNPSIDETAGPNTQLEALACGTPIVATDTLGINEFAPSDASILFSPREVDALRDAIARATTRLESLTSVAQERSEQFHADKTLENLSDIYTDLLDSR